MHYIADVSNEVMEGISHTNLSISRKTDKKYICWVNSTANNYILDTSSIEVAGLTPDTVYSIGCVEVDEDGHYQCTEYNTTVVTGEKKLCISLCVICLHVRCSTCTNFGKWLVCVKIEEQCILLYHFNIAYTTRLKKSLICSNLLLC